MKLCRCLAVAFAVKNQSICSEKSKRQVFGRTRAIVRVATETSEPSCCSVFAFRLRDLSNFDQEPFHFLNLKFPIQCFYLVLNSKSKMHQQFSVSALANALTVLCHATLWDVAYCPNQDTPSNKLPTAAPASSLPWRDV